MSVGGRGWDELSEHDRDRFLLAAVGGTEEWRDVMGEIGLDGNTASKVTTAICPIKPAPRSEAERRERERAALSFQGARPLGLAFRDALWRRDGAPAAAVASSPEIDGEIDPPPSWSPPDRIGSPRQFRQRVTVLASLWRRTERLVDRLRPAIRESVQILSRAVASGTDHAPVLPAPRKPDRGTESAMIFDGGLDGDGGTVRDDLRVMEAALARWRGMGPVLKDMTVASALRGYPPALAFVRLIAPHVRPAAIPAPSEDLAAWDAEEVRQRRMLTALEREHSLMFRLLRTLMPPIG